MAPLSLKVVLDEGAVTRTVKFESGMTVEQALAIVKEKVLTGDDGKEYGLFLTSADDERSGIWLERQRNLDYYMLRDGDQLHYLCRMRNLRIRMLDGSVKTLPVDESKTVQELMIGICARIGITNHEEYGLCHDGEDTPEEKLAPGTGTLTLKRMAQHKERDAKLEQLSKKLKTDDNVEWLDQHKTFREMGIPPRETLLLKRRLFYTDRNVDARDPVGLNLLYVQTRNAVLEGRHPVTEDQAVQFAGIQCQVQYGDFHEEKHKPGFLDLNEFLPKERASSRGMESKVLKEYRKNQGLSELDAKHLYTKTARDLPTYGVTFFLVKEKQKGKKKLVPRLLGINAESILRLDEVTKEVLQVWPLTQVKTYHAGKSETFTLNFGDYSDKEYSVKTNDAHRIRDILQGYIDIIKKRMDAQYQLNMTEHHAIMEDHVEASRGVTMEHVSHNSSKLVQESFVGPSKIISYEPGQQISQGTQIVTVQQIVVTGKGTSQQNVMKGEVPLRKDMSMEFVKKLNRLNSNSVKIVTFLTEPTDSNVVEAQKLVESMNADMPSIEEGVNAAAQKQDNEDAKKKLLDELRQLRDCMGALTDATLGNVNPEQGQEAAKNVADLSTQMYFSLDPRTIKRGALCRRSRNSFIQDDKMDATLRRASFINASHTAVTYIDKAIAELDKEYQGPPLDAAEVEELEKAAEDKIGKLNAAIALYLTANADPKNVDYSAAVTSMNTIKELLPELAKDAAILSSVKDGKSRQDLLDDIQALCDAAKRICLINKPEDHEELQDAAKDYGRISEKLLFTFRRTKKHGDSVDKQNELIELAKDVGNKTTLLLVKANELTSQIPEPRAAELDDAGVSCADAANDLLTCATLTAPCIHEPHCQSALSAAAESLSSRAQHLAVCWRPLVEHPARTDLGEHLRDRTLDLAKALDRLKAAFASLNGTTGDDADSDKVKEGRRLKFISTVGAAKKRLDDADAELNKPLPQTSPQEGLSSEELKRRLAERIAQLNATLAALVAATADKEKPDYATADLAVATISELMPEIVKDGKALSAYQDDNSRAETLADLKALCDAARDVCSSGGENSEGLNNAAAKFANTSGKLFYIFNPRAKQEKEHEILDISSSACEKASEMLAGVYALAAEVRGEAGGPLDQAGGPLDQAGGPLDQAGGPLDQAGAKVADAANALLTSAQLIAPCMSNRRCQGALTSSADALAHASQALKSTWVPLVKDPRYQQLGDKLDQDRRDLIQELDRLKKACQVGANDLPEDVDDAEGKERRRLKFITTVTNAKKGIHDAEAELDKPVIAPVKGLSTEELKKKMAERIAELNAALADLVAASADRNKPDYAAADRAVATITKLMPEIVKDGKAVGLGQSEQERAATLAQLRALCAAAADVCRSSEDGNTDSLNKSAAKLANSSGKLFYVFNPRAKQGKRNEILELASSASRKASEMRAGVQQLAGSVGGAAGSTGRAAGDSLGRAADALLATAQLTAPCVSDPRCQASLVSSAEAVGKANQHLASTWKPAIHDPRFQQLGEKLEQDSKNLQDVLDRLKNACRMAPSDGSTKDAEVRKKQRLQFVASAAKAQNAVDAAEKELEKPVVAVKGGLSPEQLRSRLARALAQLNAAVAALVAASSDRESSDYAAAGEAMDTVNKLLPQLVKDSQTFSATLDPSARQLVLSDVRYACATSRELFAAAEQQSSEELNAAAAKFAGASGKLVYTFDPRASQDKEHEILDLSSLSCEKASRLLNGVYQLAAEADLQAGSVLDHAGAKVADSANALLTTAQLTSLSMQDPQCQAALLSSADALSSATESLSSSWAPVVKDPRFTSKGKQLEEDKQELLRELERLRKACKVVPSETVQVKHLDPVQERQRLQFVKVAATFDDNMQKILKELDKPLVAARADQSEATLQSKLAQSLAQLNAAIAALLAATADRDKPNYDEAEQAIHTINQLMPQVVKETRSLCATKDEASRATLLGELRSMTDVTDRLCTALQHGDTQEAAALATKAGRLLYVISPQQRKHQRLVELSSGACEKASQLSMAAAHLAAQDEAAAELRDCASHTAVAAETLLATAQLTAPSIHEPQSQATLLSSADHLHQSGKTLAEAAAACGAGGQGQLDGKWKELVESLQGLKEAVHEEGTIKSPSRRAAPPPPKRTVSSAISSEVAQQLAAGLGHGTFNTKDANKDFLERLRAEESQHAGEERQAQLAAAALKRKTDDEKALHQQFVKTVDTVANKIRKAEDDVNKLYSAKDEVIPALSVDQTLVVQKQMEQKLAMAAVAVADLVACNRSESIDLGTASKSVTTISDLMPHIVQDAKLLRGSLDDNERKAFLADIVALFDATKKLLDSAKDDRKSIDQSAVQYANKSTKLFYVVSTDADPSQEKEILARVRVINETASSLATTGASALSSLASHDMHSLCRSGGHCAEAAATTAYTAKLVAPSIQNAESNQALTKAIDNLSTHLQAYSSTWKPLETTQYSTVRQLKTEAASLEKLLEDLKKDLASGKLVKRRTVERVVVEDTPLRQLASVVLEEAKRKAESTNTPADLRVKYAKYANELSKAIKDLDMANHRCRQASHDVEKRQQLEYAVQNLQVSLLQARPSQDDRPQNNIVDLTDYVKDIASDADALKKVCKEDQAELQLIKEHCGQISAQASRVMNPEQLDNPDGTFDDIQEVEQFAEECDKRCNSINSVIEGLKDGKLKIDLNEKATRLSEDCNMLRFATKCALATSQSASLDATLEDLTDLENRIDEMLVPGEKNIASKKWSAYGRGRLCAAASRACAGAAGDLPPAFTAYIDDVRASTDLSSEKERNRSKDHLKKVLELLKALTMTTSRHVATWQKLGHPDTAEITKQIVKELDKRETSFIAASGEPQRTALAEVDINKLLFPSDEQVKGDPQQISEQLQQAASKLSMSSCTVAQSARTPAALGRSAAAAAASAHRLAALARPLRTHDLAQSQKIDEATKEMSLQTYNVLKTADIVSQEPNNYAARRRLLDACRLLNDAINKLVRTTIPSTQVNKMKRDCGELSRNLHLQQSALSSTGPASATPYAECIDALNSQSDVLQKLNNDEPMSREQFGRTLGYVSAAVCHSAEYAAQCAYLISIADQHKEIAQTGFIDTSRITNLSEAVQETCRRIIRTDVEQGKAEEVVLGKQIQDLQQALSEAREKTRDTELKDRLTTAASEIDDTAKVLYAVLNENRPDRAKITKWTIKLVDAVRSVDSAVEAASVAPEPTNTSPETKAKCDDIMKNSRDLNSSMLKLLGEVKAADDTDPMTWVMFGHNRKAVLDAFEALLNSVKEHGKRSGVLEASQSDLEEDDGPKKSYVQIQLDLANKWLKRPSVKADVKAAGENAAHNIIQLGEKMAEDLKGVEEEEMLQLIAECKALLNDCCKKYDQDKATVLMGRLKELKKGIERGVVTRVVEDFLEGEEPLADLDILADAEKDETKRKFLLERKIAELLAHLGRVTKTARIVAGAGRGGPHVAQHLARSSDQAELLAPMLVRAAQQRVHKPDDQAAIEHYQKLLAEYAESLANVRSLCDQSVDPMEFVQTAGETMQRMREDSNHHNDPQKCEYASRAITKLANRVITVSLSSNDVRKDPELQKALKEAKERLRAAVPPPNARPSRIPILRTTGEVESVLGGEMIFKKQQQADQPIFAAAYDLHAAVREWSARDNEIVAVAKRMAVLMAKLSDYMNTDRKRELLATSKAIVSESHEVAELARKLANECTDVRIKTNLLQVCERIPTISGQLKMLATVKGSSLGQQGLKDDQEDMITLVGNAQNLMSSVQEVVKAAASATVKIASQRGSRMRWVRKNYY